MKPQNKIEALNLLNAEAPRILAELNTILAPFMGKKILKNHPWDKWVAKLSPQISALQDRLNENGIRAIPRFYTSSICLTIDTTVPHGAYGVDYVAQDFAVAGISGDTLESLRQPEGLNLRADYTAEEIEEKKAQIEKLRAEIYKIEGEIPAQFRK